MKKIHRRREYVQVGLLLLSFALLLGLLYQTGRWLEISINRPEMRGEYVQRRDTAQNVTIDGVSYRPKEKVTTVLLMGVDQREGQESIGSRNGGQVDFLRLIVIDAEQKTVSQLQIDRDTMTPITVLGVQGDWAGMRTAQISLSHGFGNGREQSCALTAKAVSNLLMGINVDFYVAMNMDGISELNDLAGGVTVTLQDDFSALDPTMTTGTTMKLRGQQAEFFVRNRYSIGVSTNVSRMARQEQYLEALTDLIDARQKADANFVGTLYDALMPYLTTNLSRGRLINEVWAAKDYERPSVIQIEGIHAVGADGFMQFTADEASIQEAVVTLFYEEVK